MHHLRRSVVLRSRRRAGVYCGVELRRLKRRLSGGGATKATGVSCQFSEGDGRLCGQVHASARQAASLGSAFFTGLLTGLGGVAEARAWGW
jgi:hypothetical protein